DDFPGHSAHDHARHRRACGEITMLTQQQIDAYQQDGYVKVEGLFSQDEVAALGVDLLLRQHCYFSAGTAMPRMIVR
ncbi:MAG TPA: hypothetical protein QF604_13250, partial [Candidatus Latescibacteria bacterium]|nr:hypothetical protein [Candidatus Latescibacterota bacterium]